MINCKLFYSFTQTEYSQIQPILWKKLRQLTGENSLKIECALGEAIINGLKYGNTPVEVKINKIGNRLIFRVRDQGKGFNGNKVLQDLLSKGLDEVFNQSLLEENGRGLPIMLAEMDKVLYNKIGNEVILMKKLNCFEQVKLDLKQYIDPDKATSLAKYFKTCPGGYGEGDIFIGISVPNQRKVAKKYYKAIDLKGIQILLNDPIHEYRLTALFILVYKFEKTKREEEKEKIVDFYLKNLSFINNWDLVDSSADKILGAYLFDKDKKILFDFARSNHLWQQRIAIISTFYFIKQNSFQTTLDIAKILLNHKHDLIHKAVGWMLREVGKRDLGAEIDFLKEYCQKMPRTMLRYAIEKFEPEMRKKFLST